jgi:hypothetical protein
MKIQIQNQSSHSFERGTLVLCDPCYFFDNDNTDHSGLWMDFCDLMFNPNNPGGSYGELSDRGVAEITIGSKTVPFLYMGTAYGDGCYDFTSRNAPKIGTDIGVDAGMICAIRAEDLKNFNPSFEPQTMGRVIPNFEGEVFITGKGVMEGQGNFSFAIDTGNDEEEEEEEDPFQDDESW